MRTDSFGHGWANMARFWMKLFEAEKSFAPAGSSLKGIINLIASGGLNGAPGFTTAALQTELDKIPIAKAKKYKDALKILIDDYEDVCYTAVEEFTTKEIAKPLNANVAVADPNWGTWGPQNKRSGSVAWNSALFDLKARVFQIAPAEKPDRWEIGFVQHCTKKSNQSTYTNGDNVDQHPITAPPWCDTEIEANSPWYTKGPHNGQTAWKVLVAGIHERVSLGMDDAFVSRKHPYLAVKAGGLVTAATITKVSCEQAFTTWLCRRFPTGNPVGMLLLKKVSYTIKGDIKVGTNGASGSSSVKIGTTETPTILATLPATSANTMNGNERWFSNGAQI